MSPRPGPRRPTVTIRLSADTIAWVDERAREEGLLRSTGEPNRSKMIRLMLVYATRHMRKGWRP